MLSLIYVHFNMALNPTHRLFLFSYHCPVRTERGQLDGLVEYKQGSLDVNLTDLYRALELSSLLCTLGTYN